MDLGGRQNSGVGLKAGLQTVVALFGKKGPSYPEAGLIIDRAGNLYGTSLYGGGGYVFELSPSSTGWIETDIYAFDGFKPGSHDGNEPATALTFGPDGTLYRTTSLGGTSNWGTVFAIKCYKKKTKRPELSPEPKFLAGSPPPTIP